jgi:two-component system OmpR family response regulator
MSAILVMEDDAATASEIALELGRLGFTVEVASDGPSALARARSGKWHAFVVDRMLPGVDGLSIIRTLRAEGIATPALVLSALDAVSERIAGLRAGGDDYLVKPFSLGELAARLEVLIRRPSDGGQTRLRLGPLELDKVARVARRGGRDLELLGREFQILEYLLCRAGQVVTRQMLLEDVFGYRFELKTNLLDVHVGRLRRKLDLPGEAPMLSTVRGVGFQLDAPLA